MANYKLILEDDFRDEFTLIVIHCSVEAYKMAFLINNHLGLRLNRKRVDLDFSKQGLEVTFPWFEYETDYISYDLLSNKCKTERARTVASGGLFGDTKADEIVTEYLLPELKKVDFVLKITSENENIPLDKLLQQINRISEVISAYELDPDELKSKNNLIFD